MQDDSHMIREFLGGPKDGLIAPVPSDETCFYLSETQMMSFGTALGYEQYCHVYESDGEGAFIHILPPEHRLPAAEWAKLVEAFGK